MGIPTVSHPVGETQANPDHSQEIRSATKKARKTSKDTPTLHPGKRGASASEEHSSRSFASIYRKSLAHTQKVSGEEATLSSPGKPKGHSSTPAASSATRLERPRKKKARSGDEGSPVLPLVNPDDFAEKPARSAHGSVKAKTRVLWGPQGERALASVMSAKPEPGGAIPAKTFSAAPSPMAVPPVAQLPKKEGEVPPPSGKPREAPPSGEFASALGAAALAGESKGLKPTEPSRREGQFPESRIRPVKGEIFQKSGPESESLTSAEGSSPTGGAPSALPAGSPSEGTGKTISGGESGSKSPLPEGAEIAAAAEASGGSSSVASPSEAGGSSPSAVISEIPGKVSSLAAGGGGQVSLEVRPPHLGPVGVRVHVDSATRQVRVELSSHDPRIRHLLAGKEGEIKESLSQSGYVLDRFVVGSQGQTGGGLSDLMGGLTASGQSAGSGGDGGTGRQDGQGSGNGSGSGGSLGSDPGGFSRQGASQSGQSGSFGRDSGGGREEGSERGVGASVPLEEMAFPSSIPSGASAPSGYHRIA